MRAEHHRNRTGSHQSAKSHRAKINGKVLTKKYLPAGMSFVPVPVTLADRDMHWSLSDLLLNSKCKNPIKRKICNVTQCRRAKGGALPRFPKGTKASSGLFSYSLYLHAAFLFSEVYNFPVLLYSTVFTSTLEDKPATGATRVLYRGQEFVHITYQSYTLEYSLPRGYIWQPVLHNKQE